MLFTFPGTIASKNLGAVLAPFIALVEAELEEVSELQISLIGFRGNARCQIRGKDGRISQIIFEAVDDTNASGGAGSRMSRSGSRICIRSDDLDWSPLAVMFGHDD